MDKVDEQPDELASSNNVWVWPLDETRYDRTPILTSAEQEALASFVQRPRDRAVVVASACQQGILARLLDPVRDALAVTQGEERFKVHSTYLFLRMCARDGRPFWAWERETWIRVLGTSTANFFSMHKPGNPTELRQYIIAVAYLLNCFSDLQALGGIEMASLAYKVFGRERVEAIFAPILAVNTQWGYETSSLKTLRRWGIQTGKPSCHPCDHCLHSFLISAIWGGSRTLRRIGAGEPPHAHRQRHPPPAGGSSESERTLSVLLPAFALVPAHHE
jgi:hypothetical protein